MDWRASEVAPDATHHLCGGAPLYEARFEAVGKFHAPGLAPVTLEGAAWHIDVRGAPAYTRRFLRTFGYYEERAAVVSAGGWHHMYPQGRDLTAVRYDWCGNFQGGRCAVRDDEGRYFHLDPEGTAVGGARWRYAGDYRDGVASVMGDDGRSTHIDLAGRPIHDRWFRDLGVFHKGFACARDDGGWTHVRRDGRPVYERRFAMVEPFYNGQARVERFDGGMEVIDERGATVVELRAVAGGMK